MVLLAPRPAKESALVARTEFSRMIPPKDDCVLSVFIKVQCDQNFPSSDVRPCAWPHEALRFRRSRPTRWVGRAAASHAPGRSKSSWTMIGGSEATGSPGIIPSCCDCVRFSFTIPLRTIRFEGRHRRQRLCASGKKKNKKNLKKNKSFSPFGWLVAFFLDQ